MSRFIFCCILVLTILSCKKEVETTTEPFVIKTIYHENFETPDPDWIPLPQQAPYIPGSECVQIDEGMLKLRFDQTIPNCGCAWIGAERKIHELDYKSPDKLGIKIKLNKGYFQQVSHYEQITEYHSTHQTIAESSLMLTTPSISMVLPNVLNGEIHESLPADLELNKIEGKEFEMIYNQGKRLFYIDGVEMPSDMVNIQPVNRNQDYIQLKFRLSHRLDVSPRIDELFVDEIEVYSWQGELPH